jgi:serine/threonine protein kinase
VERLAAYGEPVEGTPFGRYRLIELLGRGGMGEVWRAFDTVTERTVAIKVLPTHLADDNVFQQRFRREARAAAGLDEPHVVPIFDFGEIESRLYVAMRLIQGHDLQDLLSEGPLQPARAVRIIEQIASALHAAHRIGLVHRDVKPSNILITGDDFAYLIDFGIARAAEETSLTSSSITIGTWAYMAPERFKGIADARADVYALACVLYQSLTSKLPFPGESLEQLATAHMFEPPPQPSMVQDGVPPAMDQVIATGMAKDPDHRYQTAKDLALAARAALTTREQAQADTQAAPTSPAPVPPQPNSGATKSVNARLIAAAAAVVAVILAAGFIFIWRPWERQPPPRLTEPTGPTTSVAQVPPPVTTTTAAPPLAIPRTGFFGEWGQHSMSVTLAPDGSAYYKAWLGVANGTSWSATWSPMASTTAMIVLTTQLESHGDTDTNFLHRYPGEAFTFTLQPDGYATITTPSGQPTTLCPQGTGFHDKEGLCGA